MTITQALKLAATELNLEKISFPPLEAEILLSSILKKPREFLLAHGEKPLSRPQTASYHKLLKRRLKGEPAAYLTGRKEFYGLDFMVNKNILIPRPETELMVEEALKLMTQNAKGVTLVDVGTGSGCIIITLAKLIKNNQLNPPAGGINHNFIGIDISKSALAVARKNAKLHGLNETIKFIAGDLLKPIFDSKFVIRNSELMILANLPYGWKAWKNNCSRDTIGLKFEPKIALFADKNGLELYEKLFHQINNLIHKKKYTLSPYLPVGQAKHRRTSLAHDTLFALCEFDPRQTKMIKKLIRRKLPQAKFQIKKDLAGLNRLVIIKIPLYRKKLNPANRTPAPYSR